MTVPPQAAVEPPPAEVVAPRGSTGGRAALVTIDQGLSSASNLLVVLWAAHVVSAAEFGSFSLVLLVCTFVMGLVTALVSIRVVVHPEDADHRPREVLGSALVLGLVAGVGCVVVGGVQVAAGLEIGRALVVLGVLLPLLVLQDVGRWIAIARSRPLGAIVLDGVWVAGLLAAFVALQALGGAGLTTLTLAWAGTGALASLGVLVAYGWVRPREVTLRWLRERWDQSWRLLVGNVTASGSALIGASMISWVASPIAVAAVRGSMLLGRPTSAVQLALGSSAAADIAREKPDTRGLLRHQRRTMLLSGAVGVVNLVVLSVLPDWLGRAVLGNVWPVLAPLVLPISLWLVAQAAQSGVPPVLLGEHQFHTAMVVQIVGGLLTVIALVGGAMLGGAEGAVWGLVVGQVATAACWWVGLLAHLRRR